MPDPLQGYTFDPRARGGGQYRRGATGRFVSRARIIDLMEHSVEQRGRRLVASVEALSEGRISVNVFTSRAKIMLERQYLQMRALGKGGWDRLTPADYAQMSAHIQDEVRRMNIMARELVDGKITLPQALNRMRMYMGKARANFFEAERQALGDVPAGMVRIERRHLGIADHCDDCLRWHDLGWQAEGILPLPSQESGCDGNCRCSIERKVIPIDQFPSWEGQFSQAKMTEAGKGPGYWSPHYGRPDDQGGSRPRPVGGFMSTDEAKNWLGAWGVKFDEAPDKPITLEYLQHVREAVEKLPLHLRERYAPKILLITGKRISEIPGLEGHENVYAVGPKENAIIPADEFQDAGSIHYLVLHELAHVIEQQPRFPFTATSASREWHQVWRAARWDNNRDKTKPKEAYAESFYRYFNTPQQRAGLSKPIRDFFERYERVTKEYLQEAKMVTEVGKGPGYWAPHFGRPDEVGGSSPRDGGARKLRPEDVNKGAPIEQQVDDEFQPLVPQEPHDDPNGLQYGVPAKATESLILGGELNLRDAQESLHGDLYREKLDDFSDKLLHSPISIRRTDALESIMRDERVKTQFETHTTQGGEDLGYRAELEEANGYIPSDCAPEDRPVYAYMSAFWSNVDGYGPIELVLNDEVRTRSTFTFGDSLDTEKTFIPLVVRGAKWGLANAGEWPGPRPFAQLRENESTALLLDGPGPNIGYVEVQIQRGVRTKDIRRIVIHQGALTLAPGGKWVVREWFKAGVDAAKKAGIEVVFDPETE